MLPLAFWIMVKKLLYTICMQSVAMEGVISNNQYSYTVVYNHLDLHNFVGGKHIVNCITPFMDAFGIGKL